MAFLFSNSEQHDCRKDRAIALENEAETPDAGIFIPSCTPEGKWTPAQCHKSTGYCWCVDENSGTPISGTSTQGVRPKCDFANEREIPGSNSIDHNKPVTKVTLSHPIKSIIVLQGVKTTTEQEPNQIRLLCLREGSRK